MEPCVSASQEPAAPRFTPAGGPHISPLQEGAQRSRRQGSGFAPHLGSLIRGTLLQGVNGSLCRGCQDASRGQFTGRHGGLKNHGINQFLLFSKGERYFWLFLSVIFYFLSVVYFVEGEMNPPFQLKLERFYHNLYYQ